MTLGSFAGRMFEARARTLALCDLVDNDAFCRQFHPGYSPVGWHLGHVAVVQAHWLLERTGGASPLPEATVAMFTPERNPKDNRVHLPPRREVVQLAREIADRTGQWLEGTGANADPRMLWSVLQHEHQHCETIAMVLALATTAGARVRPLGIPEAPEAAGRRASAGGPRWVTLPGSTFLQGADTPAAYDNERAIHPVAVGPFALATHAVTRGEYSEFIASGAYRQPAHWTDEGWQWVRAQGVDAPQAWDTRSDPTDAPVCGLSWYEADAFARWAGARLPTEAEWERAAAWDTVTRSARTYPWGERPPDVAMASYDRPRAGPDPVDAHPAGATPSGLLGLAGGVWEWTGSWFAPYPDFTPWPYEGYSTPWFGTHRVLRGGSFATRATLLRSAFRNWYTPSCREVFAGVRLARDASGRDVSGSPG